MTQPTPRPLASALTSTVLAGALFGVVLLVFESPPIASLAGVVGGLLGCWLGRGYRYRATAFGALAGCAVGAGLHFNQHRVEGRLEPEGGLLPHMLADAALGVGIAALVLAGAFLLTRCFRKSSSRSR